MIYEYKCPQGHLSEAWAKVADRNNPITCRCGEQAKRIMSSPKIATPTDSDKWADMHEKEAKREENPNLTHY